MMKIGRVYSQLRPAFGLGSSRSARRSSRGPVFGPGAGIMVRRAVLLGRANRARPARRVNTREKTIAGGVEYGVGEDRKLRKKRGLPNKTNTRTSPTLPLVSLLFSQLQT